jgi:hypothetical protein
MNQEADQIRQGLNTFLEQKRESFGRLYFVSNEELLDVFGKTDKVVEDITEGKDNTFLTSMFEGVEKVVIDEKTQDVTGVVSNQGEVVTFTKAIKAD